MEYTKITAAGALIATLGACAQPPQVPLELAPIRKAAPPAQPQGVTHNPVRYVQPPALARQSALQRLRDANRDSSKDLFDGYFTGSKLLYRWRDGEVYSVVAAKNRTTTIQLNPGEAYVNHSFGDDRFIGLDTTWAGTKDSRAAITGPSASAVPIIAFVGGVCTDLTLYTTWRTILMNICANGTRDAYNRVIAFTFPDDEAAILQASLRQPLPVDQASGVPVEQLDTRYAFKGDPIFQPDGWSGSTDGRRKVYLVPPKSLGFLPVPYIVGSDGLGDNIEYRAKPRKDGDGSYLEILASPPPWQIVLQYGDKQMTVTRTGG